MIEAIGIWMLKSMSAYLNFNCYCGEAFNLSRKVFGVSFFGGAFKEGKDFEDVEKILHTGLVLPNSTELKGLDVPSSRPGFQPGNNFSICIMTE